MPTNVSKAKLRQFVKQREPFASAMLKQPNAETWTAMQEIEEGHGELFQSTTELFCNWEKD